MSKQKIGISLQNRLSLPAIDLVETIANIGFDAISPCFDKTIDVKKIIQKAKNCGLTIQSLHASFRNADKLWYKNSEQGAKQLKELLSAIEICKIHNIPILVCHVWIGWNNEIALDQVCYDAFDTLVDVASKSNIKLAFENTEGLQYLDALMERYKNNDTVGFCWDSGHEQCYSPDIDLLQKFGDRLICTHLNDNLGCRNLNGATPSINDLHFLPLDGIADWDYNVKRLRASKPLEILNFEVLNTSKPGQQQNKTYQQMSPKKFFSEAFIRARKIANDYSK